METARGSSKAKSSGDVEPGAPRAASSLRHSPGWNRGRGEVCGAAPVPRAVWPGARAQRRRAHGLRVLIVCTSAGEHGASVLSPWSLAWTVGFLLLLSRGALSPKGVRGHRPNALVPM